MTFKEFNLKLIFKKYKTGNIVETPPFRWLNLILPTPEYGVDLASGFQRIV